MSEVDEGAYDDSFDRGLGIFTDEQLIEELIRRGGERRYLHRAMDGPSLGELLGEGRFDD